MKAGLNASQMRKVLSLEDRREAIKLGVTLCSEGDILLIAGKGHEKYQEINGERFPFDDMAILKSILNTKICCITYLHTYEAFNFPGAGVFQYISFRAAMAVIVSLLISLIFGKRIISFLAKKQVGESIRDLGLEGQVEKAGTPTMGGLIIIVQYWFLLYYSHSSIIFMSS